MHPAGTTGFGPAAKPHLPQQRIHFKGDNAYVCPLYPRAWIEIDAKFVRVVEVARADGVWVQFNATEVDDPRQPRGIVYDHFFGSAAGRKRQCCCSQPRRPLGRCTFLIKGLALGAVHESLEHDRAVLDSGEGARRDREVVMDEVKFRDSGQLRKI